MIEGSERERLDRITDEITVSHLITRPVFMAEMDDSAQQKEQANIEDYFDKESERIERSHRDFGSPTAQQEEVKANAFKSIFAERRKLNDNI